MAVRLHVEKPTIWWNCVEHLLRQTSQPWHRWYTWQRCWECVLAHVNCVASWYINSAINAIAWPIALIRDLVGTEDCGIVKVAGLTGSIAMASAEVAEGAQVLPEVAGSEDPPLACASEVAVFASRRVASLWDAVAGLRLP